MSDKLIINKVITSSITEPFFEKKNDGEIEILMPEITGYKINKNNSLCISTTYNRFKIVFKNPKKLLYELVNSNEKIKEKRSAYQKQFKKVCKNCLYKLCIAKMEKECELRNKISENFEKYQNDFHTRLKNEHKIYDKYKNHTCDLFDANSIETPFEITSIEIDNDKKIIPELKLVKVRPCAKEYNNKTFVGILINYWYPCSESFSINRETKKLKIRLGISNPLIYIPELNIFVRGYNSWWGEISDINNYSPITNDVIDNLWYVKMAKQLF